MDKQPARAGRPLTPLPKDGMDPAVRAFAERLREFYVMLGMTLMRLYEELRVNSSYLSGYLNGKRLPDPDFLERLFDLVEKKTSNKVTPTTRDNTLKLYQAACKVLEPAWAEVYRLRNELEVMRLRAETAEEELQKLYEQIQADQSRRNQLGLDLRQLDASTHEATGLELERLRRELDNVSRVRDELAERIQAQQVEFDLKVRNIKALSQDYQETELELREAEARLEEELQERWDSGDADAMPSPNVGSAPIEIKVVEVTGSRRKQARLLAEELNKARRELADVSVEKDLLRNNVNAMFINLSRRSQSLVQRQLRLIDELENAEQDPDQLASLFKLDHLATRMRRNSENLLLLAGEEPGRRWSQPVRLIDVLRAAASEVEYYERVTLRSLPVVGLAGPAVNDVVHLVAELLENATSFSAPETKVSVTGNLVNTGVVMLEIEDSGIGMTPKELDDANERLANPPVVDVAISRRMGLFVVSRLATRHGIQVRLRRSATGGIEALVLVPKALLVA